MHNNNAKFCLKNWKTKNLSDEWTDKIFLFCIKWICSFFWTNLIFLTNFLRFLKIMFSEKIFKAIIVKLFTIARKIFLCVMESHCKYILKTRKVSHFFSNQKKNLKRKKKKKRRKGYLICVTFRNNCYAIYMFLISLVRLIYFLFFVVSRSTETLIESNDLIFSLLSPDIRCE